MEKKYIWEHLKGREWIKDLFNWITDGADTEYWLKRKYQTDNTLLVKDLEQLLDKAREEGYQKAVTQIMEDYGEYFNDGCGCCSTKLLNDELSKLKDNK